jgi:hypothetical protein
MLKNYPLLLLRRTKGATLTLIILLCPRSLTSLRTTLRVVLRTSLRLVLHISLHLVPHTSLHPVLLLVLIQAPDISHLPVDISQLTNLLRARLR